MNTQLLVIDDDRAIHRLVGAHLANSQTSCFFAVSGAEGIRSAVEMKPAAILLDMEMPNMNGMEVCASLKSNPVTRHIPIMFVTADRTLRCKVGGIEMGAVDYLTKPFDPLELRARVRSVLRTSSDLQSAQARAGFEESTGLWNRAYLIKQLEKAVASAARNKQMLCLGLFSIDHFCALAVKMGQPSGDDLFRDAAEAMSASARLEDVLCRWDTNTIAVLGFVDDPNGGRLLAERLRCSIEGIGGRSFIEAETVTCSVGLVISRDGAGPLILERAQQALNEARMTGNCVVLARIERLASFDN